MQTAIAGALVLALAPATAFASFHLMQIERVTAGANGDVDRQAIQLRMRTSGQNLVTNGRVVAWDAAGQNPVVVGSFDAVVANADTGDRILLATAEFEADPELLPDFLMARPIPEHYLDAGRLTFEAHGGLIYWSLCWGGAGYTGSTTGSPTNDLDGEFGPCYPHALPARGRDALVFTGAAGDVSTDNASDYAVTDGVGEFTNNARESSLVSNTVVFADGMDR